MAAQLIDGKQVAKTIEAEVVAAIRTLGIAPGLVAVRVGNDPASEVYVRSKAKKARELGLRGDELIHPDVGVFRLFSVDRLAGNALQVKEARHDVRYFDPSKVGVLPLAG